MAIDLVFSAAPATNGSLVFGDDGSAPPITDATIALVTSLPSLGGTVGIALGGRVSLVAALPGLSGVIPVLTTIAQYISFQTLLPGLSGDIGVRYDSRTERPLVSQAQAASQIARPLAKGLQSAAQSAQARPVGTSASHQIASQLIRGIPLHHDSAIRLDRGVAALHTLALRLAAHQTSAPHQDAIRTRHSAQAQHSSAERLPTPQTTLSHQDAYRDRRLQVSVVHQDATAFYVGLATSAGKALPLDRGWSSRFEKAMRPPAGMYVRPLPPDPQPCYLPSGALLFDAEWSADGNLVFICERHIDPPTPGETVVVPVRKVYLVINDVSLRRVDGNIVLPTLSMSLSLDVDSWTWSFSAALPGSVLSDLEPAVSGAPVEIEATINGVPYRALIESIGRSREFGKNDIRVQGRGKTALLDSPYAPVQNFGNTAARTAQQIMGDVLTVNGVPMDWAADWNLDDWLVPAGVFSHQGSYISALNTIVAAAGGYIQPHASLQTLIVLPRYPVVPWKWAAEVTPDYDLPSDVTTREAIEWVEMARYNRVYVSGQQQGVLGQVTITGTAGDMLAPMVTDALITNAVAARQRGISVLGNTGRQANISLRLPVLAETGVITPGKFVRYTDAGVARMGIVRSTSVDVGLPEVWQTIGVETHV